MRGKLHIKRACGLSSEYGAISNTLLLRVFHHGEAHGEFRAGTSQTLHPPLTLQQLRCKSWEVKVPNPMDSTESVEECLKCESLNGMDG
jgi:hypothetical protein